MKHDPGPEQIRRLRALAALPEEEVDTADIPEAAAWSGAVRGNLYRPRKLLTSLRLDADVLEWFKAQGAGYQTAMNSVLRDYARGRLRPAAPPHEAAGGQERGAPARGAAQGQPDRGEKSAVPPRS